MHKPSLLTIPMSHYCEKARWALERLGIDYVEVRHLQGFHWFHSFYWARRPMVPILRMDGETISDSTAILQFLDKFANDAARLYPALAVRRREVEALEDLFDEELGVYSRKWVYAHYLQYPPAKLISIAGQGTPAWERRLMAPIFPFFRRALAWRLGDFSKGTIDAGLLRVREILTDVEQRLSDGRPYLCGDSFTAADLSFACMAAPLVLPRNYGIRLPDLDELPEAIRLDVETFRARAAGVFALRLFDRERHKRATAPMD
jgi:glutathione S-transferase